ncbi:uncharacterized protein VTP21DRAFT_7627 [Calcarisporiella thermophila]|uniref:uncharacterized protein n=1 Tax=Calcarisporiella thermophila TaxID=911321 RepID=UPI0037441EA6
MLRIFNVATLYFKNSCGLRHYTTMIRTYTDAINKLNSLQSNAAVLEMLRKKGRSENKRSLPEMREYCKRIGYQTSEFDSLNIIHVAGTKGKGSTCAFTESILRHCEGISGKPLRTGLYTSPHLIAVRERIRIDGRPLSEEQFAKYFFECWDRLEATKGEVPEGQPEKPVYFRFLTLLAFHVFMQEKIDVVVLEVGVGGEYDSTNIVERPVVCGITSLGLDHVAVLGNTLEDIAWNKAGIIKSGVPVFSVMQPEECLRVIEKRAAEKNAPLSILSNGSDSFTNLGLAGEHQRANAALAVALSKQWLGTMRGQTLKDDIPREFERGLTAVKWPGRAQTLTVTGYKATWYLDGAHTAESMQACIDWFGKTLENKEKQRILLFNCTNGRDGAALLRTLSTLQSQVKFDHALFCTNITYADNTYKGDNQNNMVNPDDKLLLQHGFAQSWSQLVPECNAHVFPTVEHATKWVKDQGDAEVLVTGSLQLVGNVMTVLGVEPQ